MKSLLTLIAPLLLCCLLASPALAEGDGSGKECNGKRKAKFA